MSRIGKLPVEIPQGVKIEEKDGKLIVQGPKGKLEVPIQEGVSYKIEGNVMTFHQIKPGKKYRALWGLMRKLVYNAVQGVTKGFEKHLQIVGAGYRAGLQGKKLVIQIGFSHPVEIEPPEGITFTLKDPANILVSGIDKQKVGQVAANIRAIKPPDPYKLKGIRYADEKLIQKERKLGAK